MATLVKYLGMATLAGALLSGCARMPAEVEAETVNNAGAEVGLDVVDIGPMQTTASPVMQAQEQDSFGSVNKPDLYSSVQGSYKGRPLTKHVGDYVKNMTQDLIANMEYVNETTPLGVTHFSLLDSDLQTTNLLGQQMAESFVHELHKFRVPVIDFKATDYIRVTETGDFILTRDYLELNSALPMEYVLTGTMTKHQGGFLVNARILGIESRAVVASAQTLIPFYVVDALIPSESMSDDKKDGVKLIKG